MDVEGAEDGVIEGAEATISNFKPILVMELSKLRIPKISKLLEPHGYSFHVVPYGTYGNVQVTARANSVFPVPILG